MYENQGAGAKGRRVLATSTAAFACRALGTATACALVAALTACEPEVGSESWCDAMREKPRGDWTVNEGADFARHCLFEGEE